MLMIRKGLLLILIIIGLITDIRGQNGGFNSIGINLYPGFLFGHRDDSKNLEAHIIGYEFSFYRKNIQAPWASKYNRPEIGLGFLYMYLGQPKLTGNVFAVLPSITTTIGHIGKADIRFKAGSGLGYLTKKFDPYTNRRNQAIGSHLNGAMQLFFLLEKKTKGNYSFNAGIGLTHFSNGSFRVPNLGVNMPSLYFGYSSSGKNQKVTIQKDTFRFRRWQTSFAYAYKERTLTKPKGFNIFNLNVVRLTAKSLKADWRIGSDIYLDKTHHYLEFPGEILKGLNPTELIELGFFGGHQWLISKVHFKIDVGFYAYKPSKNKFITYQRLGFNYHVSTRFFLTANLKTHFGIADHITWGVGYRI
jgi:Lipid A 3-O-deacylase (PagL)